MIPKTLTVALIIPVLLTTTEIAHAAENRYGMRNAPPQYAPPHYYGGSSPYIVMTVLTAYSGKSYPVTASRIGRVITSGTGAMAVAYDRGSYHIIDGPENVLVESDIADLVVTTRGLQWMEFPANVDTDVPFAIPPPAARRPVSVCYRIRRAAGEIVTKVVETTDAFGTQRLAIGRPESLCVPGIVGLLGDPYFYYPAYGVPFPPVPPSPTRLCFKVRPERPALRPPPVAVATFFGDAVAMPEPVREHCVEATITPGTQEEHW